MAGLSRLLCLGGGRPPADDWAPGRRSVYEEVVRGGARRPLAGQLSLPDGARVRARGVPTAPPLCLRAPQAAAGHRSRVLGLVEEELGQRFLALPPARQAAGEPLLPPRRVHQAALPTPQLRLCSELLHRLAALDAAREEAKQARRGTRTAAGGEQ